MKLFYIIVSVIFLSSCSGNSKLDSIIDHTSSMQIIFYDTLGNTAGIYKSNNTEEINLLNKFFTGNEALENKCSYTGKIMLHGKTEKEIIFNLDNKCIYILFQLDGKIYIEDISLEGIKYFKKLKYKVTTPVLQAK